MWYQFPAPIILRVTGKDAQRYLNARLSNDSRALLPGGSMSAAALTAQGRVEGLFTVFCKEVGSYLLLCEGGSGDDVRGSFARFIVADRVTVSDLSSSWIALHISSEKVPEMLLAQVNDAGGAVANERRVGPIGCSVLIPKEQEACAHHILEASYGARLSHHEYDYKRAIYGTPSFPTEINDSAILTECGVPEAVSFTKGCYVGQEVIERSDAIGKVPRHLVCIELPSGFLGAPEASVCHRGGDKIGKVVSLYKGDATAPVIAFAFLKNGKFNVGDTVLVQDTEGKILPKR